LPVDFTRAKNSRASVISALSEEGVEEIERVKVVIFFYSATVYQYK